MPKNIALFIDGTWNAPSEGAQDTNVFRLFDSTEVEESPNGQVTYYLPGVGTRIDTSMRGHPSGEHHRDEALQQHGKGGVSAALGTSIMGITQGSTGSGTGERIREAYAFLSASYVPGDKVFLFGFSRGAYAARSLINFVESVGLLLKGMLHKVPYAYRLYEKGADAASISAFSDHLVKVTGRGPLTSQDDALVIPLHFIGLWDSVGAMGLPWAKRSVAAKRTDAIAAYVPTGNVAIRHALSIHDLREVFNPLVWVNVPPGRDIKQIWFPGAHSDVGGGYATAKDGNAVEPMLWMAGEVERYGLHFKPPPNAIQNAVDSGANRCVFHTGLEYGIFRIAPPVAREALLGSLAASRLISGSLRLHVSVKKHLAQNTPPYNLASVKASAKEKLMEIDAALQDHVRTGHDWEETAPMEPPRTPPPKPIARRPAPSEKWAELVVRLSETYVDDAEHETALQRDDRERVLSECGDEIYAAIRQSQGKARNTKEQAGLRWIHDNVYSHRDSAIEQALDDLRSSLAELDWPYGPSGCDLEKPIPGILYMLHHSKWDSTGTPHEIEVSRRYARGMCWDEMYRLLRSDPLPFTFARKKQLRWLIVAAINSDCQGGMDTSQFIKIFEPLILKPVVSDE